jgi:predicted nucleic acid-binding protein
MNEDVVVLDACVLYPAPLRDFLMHLALTNLFHARWTEEIHEEWMRSLLKNRSDLTQERLYRTKDLMNSQVHGCLVSGYEYLIPSLTLPDENDRHVLAAAIQSEANTIVTFNLSDFPYKVLQQYDIEAQHPDDFISGWVDVAPIVVCGAAQRQRLNLKNPPKSVEESLVSYTAQGLTKTVAKLTSYRELL